VSWLSKAAGGGGGALGGVTGGLGSIFGGGGADGILGSFLDPIFGGASQVPNINIPGYNQGDSQALSALMGKQKSLYDQSYTDTKSRYADQLSELQKLIGTQMGDTVTNLTTGQQGEALREKYNNLGLLNSGAFNQGLANAFAPVQQQANQELMAQGLNTTNVLQGISDQSLQNQIGLGQSGIQRQFGLEDAQTNAMINQLIANAQMKQQHQQGNMGFLGGLINAGASMSGSR